MNEVPEEVIQHVLVFIPTKNYVSLAAVNSTWNALFNADSPLWKYLCERIFMLQRALHLHISIVFVQIQFMVEATL
jgi:hypothetical protein